MPAVGTLNIVEVPFQQGSPRVQSLRDIYPSDDAGFKIAATAIAFKFFRTVGLSIFSKQIKHDSIIHLSGGFLGKNLLQNLAQLMII